MGSWMNDAIHIQEEVAAAGHTRGTVSGLCIPRGRKQRRTLRGARLQREPVAYSNSWPLGFGCDVSTGTFCPSSVHVARSSITSTMTFGYLLESHLKNAARSHSVASM